LIIDIVFKKDIAKSKKPCGLRASLVVFVVWEQT